MNIVHIVGRRNHGKTTLITDLVQHLAQAGVKVVTAKYCGHSHELDTAGKDSFRHRTSGAAMAAVITPEMLAVYRPRTVDEDVYAQLMHWAGDADLVLVEGDIEGPGIKVEVWRQAAGGLPLADDRDDILALITDDSHGLAIPTWPRADMAWLATRILRRSAPLLAAGSLE